MEHDDLDSIGGIPDELDDLARAEQRLTIRTERRRYDKPVTIVEGFETGALDVDLATIASELKRALGTGGTVTDGRIELQGDQTGRVPALLRERGFAVEE